MATKEEEKAFLEELRKYTMGQAVRPRKTTPEGGKSIIALDLNQIMGAAETGEGFVILPDIESYVGTPHVCAFPADLQGEIERLLDTHGIEGVFFVPTAYKPSEE